MSVSQGRNSLLGTNCKLNTGIYNSSKSCCDQCCGRGIDWSPDLLSQCDPNSVLSLSLLCTSLQHTEAGGRCLSGEGLHLGNVNNSGARSPLTQFNSKFGWLSSGAHFCCTAELHAGNSCSLGLSEENIQIFQKRKGAKEGGVRLSGECSPGGSC